MRYLTEQELLIIHALIIDTTRGSHGVRDIGLFKSLLARPMTAFGGKDAYPDVFLKAAVYIEAIARYHVFVDGNKRTSFAAGVRFLSINGLDVNINDREVVDTVISIAVGDMKPEQIAGWLKSHSKPISKKKNKKEDR